MNELERKIRQVLNKVEMREAVKRKFIHNNMPVAERKAILREMTAEMLRLYPTVVYGMDAECEVLTYMYDDKRFTAIGANKFDVLYWWTKSRMNNYEDSDMRP